MQHETAEIKKSVKKYKTVKGIEKESISFYANLGAKSEFDDGDIVAVALLDDFNELDNISADEIKDLKNDVADKDETIAANNERIDKLNAELKDKFNLINDVTAKLKASEKTVVDLKSDISAKDKMIADLDSELKVADATINNFETDVADKNAELVASKKVITENEKTISELSAKNDALHERLDELTDLLSGKDKTIAELDESIVNYRLKIAELNAVDIDKLKDKSDELDIVKDELVAVTKRLDDKSNVISLLQNQIMELQQLVNYKDKEIDAVKNQNVIYKLIGKDATANIPEPTLYLIDSSGNLIKNDKSDIDVDATVDDNVDVATESDNDNVDDSGKDRIIKI